MIGREERQEREIVFPVIRECEESAGVVTLSREREKRERESIPGYQRV